MPSLQPIDYTFKGIQDPSESFISGMKQTLDIQNTRAQLVEAQRLKAQQEAMARDMSELALNPTVSGINRMMAKYPTIADKYKPLLESMTDQQKQSRIRQATDIYAPMVSGRKDIALQNLNTQIEAAKNAGDQQSLKSLDTIKQLIESPETGKPGDNLAIIGLGSFLASTMGEKEFAKTFEALGKERREETEAPAKLSKAKADALIAENKATYGEDKQTLNTTTGIFERQPDGSWKNTGLMPTAQAGVSVNLGTPQFAIEKATGEQVIYQPSPTGKAQIIRGLAPVTEQTKETSKESAKFNKLANVIDIAKKTLEKASGSYAGALAAGAQRAAGVSSETTKANAKMKALQAAMMMNMPRMEGPQSDRDVQLYREQAGQIGDPTIPIEDRLAALDVLGEIMDRYKIGKPREEPKKAGFSSVDDLMTALGKK